MNRIYFDNAATSWPKPESVYDAINRYQREVGVAAGRGSYRSAEEVERTITQTRMNIARLIGASDSSPNQCVFTQNCTDALNLALHGLLRAGDHVVTTVAEHNSILRPLATLASTRNVTWDAVGVDPQGVVDIAAMGNAIKDETRLIAVTHASNVTGTLQPIEAIAKLAKQHGYLLLVDAAQTLGHVPIDVAEQQIDLLAAPGHKGLLGPLGTGFLYVRAGLETDIHSLRQGGTGTQSELPEQPGVLPAKFEAGNPNAIGLYGLNAGVRYVIDKQLDNSTHLRELSTAIVDALSETQGVQLYSNANDCGIVAFNIEGYDPREVATILDSSAGVEVRAGLHCAPLMHRSMGTFEGGGTVRASCGHFSTAEEIDKLVAAVRMLAESAV